MFCDDLEGWGKLRREGIYVIMADLLCCMAETTLHYKKQQQ